MGRGASVPFVELTGECLVDVTGSAARDHGLRDAHQHPGPERAVGVVRALEARDPGVDGGEGAGDGPVRGLREAAQRRGEQRMVGEPAAESAAEVRVRVGLPRRAAGEARRGQDVVDATGDQHRRHDVLETTVHGAHRPPDGTLEIELGELALWYVHTDSPNRPEIEDALRNQLASERVGFRDHDFFNALIAKYQRG